MLSLPDTIGSLVVDFGSAISIPPVFLAGAFTIIITLGLFAIFKILTKSWDYVFIPYIKYNKWNNDSRYDELYI